MHRRSGRGSRSGGSSGGGAPSGVPGGAAPPLANPGGSGAAAALGLGAASHYASPSVAHLLATQAAGAAPPSAADKIARELFVGNTPPGTSEVLLMQFLNGALRRVGLCGPGATPIMNCRTNAKFAFVECATVEDANRGLNLNGIPFLGASLRVSRPSKYGGPHVPSQTWQQLTGQPLPPGMVPVPENSSIGGPEEKITRELFVGNTTPEMTESMLKDFLGRAMEQVGLTRAPGNPVRNAFNNDRPLVPSAQPRSHPAPRGRSWPAASRASSPSSSCAVRRRPRVRSTSTTSPTWALS